MIPLLNIIEKVVEMSSYSTEYVNVKYTNIK